MAAKVITCPSCGVRTKIPAVASGRPRCPSCKTDLPWLVAADDETFAAVAESGKLLVLVDLWAPWCPPCRQVAPLLEQLAVERAGSLKVVKVNVDDAPRTQAKFSVQAIPTLVLLRGGREVARKAGALPLPALRSWIDSQLKGTAR